MADQPSVFEQPTTPEAAPVETPTPPANTFDDLLKTITREDGSPKYSDIPSALQSIPHAQQHISKLEQEKQEMAAQMQALQEEVAKRKAVEEVLETMGRKDNAENTTPQFDPTMLGSVVQEELKKAEAQRTAQQNVSVVADAFKNKYGDKAEATFYEKAEALGIGRVTLNELAAKSPKAVFELFGMDSKPSTSSVPKGNINSEALGTNATNEVSARVMGKKASDLTAAWRNAGLKVKGEG